MKPDNQDFSMTIDLEERSQRKRDGPCVVYPASTPVWERFVHFVVMHEGPLSAMYTDGKHLRANQFAKLYEKLMG